MGRVDSGVGVRRYFDGRMSGGALGLGEGRRVDSSEDRVVKLWDGAFRVADVELLDLRSLSDRVLKDAIKVASKRYGISSKFVSWKNAILTISISGGDSWLGMGVEGGTLFLNLDSGKWWGQSVWGSDSGCWDFLDAIVDYLPKSFISSDDVMDAAKYAFSKSGEFVDYDVEDEGEFVTTIWLHSDKFVSGVDKAMNPGSYGDDDEINYGSYYIAVGYLGQVFYNPKYSGSPVSKEIDRDMANFAKILAKELGTSVSSDVKVLSM
jgi:hypothetical protein